MTGPGPERDSRGAPPLVDAAMKGSLPGTNPRKSERHGTFASPADSVSAREGVA